MVGRLALAVALLVPAGTELGAADDLLFKAVDPQGKPVARAVASLDRGGMHASEPTNESGWGVLRGWDGRSDVFVIASHFGMEVAHSSSVHDGRVIVPLKKANTLEIVVQTSRGTPVQEALVLLQTDGGPVFHGEIAVPVSMWRSKYCAPGGTYGGGCSYAKGQVPDACYVILKSNTDGRVCVEDVNRDLGITLWVTDELLAPLSEPEVIRVKEGESVKSTKTILDPLGDVVVCVSDEHGDPLRKARVKVTSVNRPVGRAFENMQAFPKRTDQDGRCRITGVRSTHASVVVELEGYEAWYRGDFAIDNGGSTLPVTLKRRDHGG